MQILVFALALSVAPVADQGPTLEKLNLLAATVGFECAHKHPDWSLTQCLDLVRNIQDEVQPHD
jgi:hypothetical protein